MATGNRLDEQTYRDEERINDAGRNVAEATHTGGPMSSPAPFLAAIAAGAIVLLVSLMVIDFVWTASAPVAVAHAPASHAAPLTTAPATQRAPG